MRKRGIATLTADRITCRFQELFDMMTTRSHTFTTVTAKWDGEEKLLKIGWTDIIPQSKELIEFADIGTYLHSVIVKDNSVHLF